MATRDAILSIIDKSIDQQQFLNLHWEGTFQDYLQLVSEKPFIARNAFQRPSTT